MKREIITTDSYGRITIPSDTGNIWMNEMELVELFGVIAPTLRAAIRAVSATPRASARPAIATSEM